MAARKKKTTTKKTQYVRARQRKGSSGVLWRRALTVGVLLVLVGGMLLGIKAGFDWVGRKLYSENPRFEIQHLIISCDGRLTEDYIRESSGLREGMNIWELSFDEIEKRLLTVSLIESVHLERKLPHTLIVKVKERVPVAMVSGRVASRYPFMVDRYGVVLPHRRTLASTMPLIKGLDMDLAPGEAIVNSDVDIALKIIGMCDSSSYLRTYVRIENMDLKYSDFIDMRLQGGTRVRMPRFSLKPKLQNLATIIKIANGQGRRVKEVDLTLDSAKVPVTYY